jgi:hypothetical protein
MKTKTNSETRMSLEGALIDAEQYRRDRARSPYEIYESQCGAYDPDKPPTTIYSVWFSEQKAEYIRQHPEAKRNMIDGNFFEAELQRFFAWLNATFPIT